jgi:hypothetical protein
MNSGIFESKQFVGFRRQFGREHISEDSQQSHSSAGWDPTIGPGNTNQQQAVPQRIGQNLKLWISRKNPGARGSHLKGKGRISLFLC